MGYMMELSEYFEQFALRLNVDNGTGFPANVAAEIAAAYSIGLDLDQLQQFLARRTEITSVAVALKGNTLPAEQIERILDARRNGAVHPKEVLALAFAKDEIHEKFHDDL